MKFSSLCKSASITIQAAKLRSFLAILGILIGTASVVALMSAGHLAIEQALAQFKTLGTDLLGLSVMHDQNKAQGHAQALSLQFWRTLPEKVPFVKHIAPYATLYQMVSYQGHTLQASIIGADETLQKSLHVSLKEGRFVSFVDAFEHYCVIGAEVARQISNNHQSAPLHKQILIGRTFYTVIGIAESAPENSFFNADINRAIIIPISSISLVDTTSAINNAILLLKPESPIDTVIERIKTLIHQESPALTLFPRSAKQIIASMESQGRIFTLLLAVIGGISLLVGGIGVMNIMLVSVSERKKEIGIRKAVGAKNEEIQMLFLIESMFLSLLGGSLGVVLGLLFTRLLAYYNHWIFVFYATPVLAGFLVSFLTGVFFGFYPARRAAKMEVVVSLRSE